MNKSEKFWDKRSKEYDKQEEKYEQNYNKIIENTKKYLNINDIALDYGCGTGIITNKIAESVKEIHAIDISSQMIAVAKRKADERKA
jgi:ubiquinone/menaquinone biosynthesis C-methylase UbiE